MKLSVVLITLNEEKNLPRTLSAVNDIADEIVIADSGSTDRTEEIAGSFSKTKFFSKPFSGYGAQKNWALNKCSGEWILFLDANEVPDAEMLLSIQTVLSEANPSANVYDASSEICCWGESCATAAGAE